MSAAMAFIIFREQITTIQGLLSAREDGVSESMVRWAQHIRPVSIVLVQSTVKEPDKRIHGASAHGVELLIQQLHVVSAIKTPAPFSVYEAEEASDGHALSDRVRLSNRILDLRTPTSQAIFRSNPRFVGLSVLSWTSIIFSRFIPQNCKGVNRRRRRCFQAQLLWPTCLSCPEPAAVQTNVYIC